MDPGPDPAAGALSLDPGGRVRRLDGVRGAAVLLVVVYHASYLTAGWGPRLLPGGFVGVDLFFVLSGYLITRLLLAQLDDNDRIEIGAFMVRRFRRLYPALIATVVGVVWLLVATGRVGSAPDQMTGGELAASALATVFYVSNFVQARGWEFPIELSHTWSLAIEAQFYLLWPFVLAGLRRVGSSQRTQAATVIVAMVVIAAHRAAMWTDQAHYLPLYLRTDTRLDVILAGCLLAMVVHWGWVRSGRWLRVPGVGGAAFLVAAGLFSETGDSRMYAGFGLSVVALSALAVVASALLDAEGPVGRVVSWRPLAALGDRSYSLYLWHVPVFLTVARHIGDTSVVLRVFTGMGLTALVTEFSFRFVESSLRGGTRPAGRSLVVGFASWVEAHRRPVLVGAVAVASLPMGVAVVALSRYAWYPIGDLAQAMLRQLSFWSDPPLVGPAGRIGTFARQGNHPGPAMFWVTWPVWALLGRSSWAYQAAVATVVVTAFGLAVGVSRKVHGWLTALTVAVVGAILMRSYGAVALTQPWNPYVPLLPFLAFVIACWAVASRRWSMLPVAVLTGSFCIQCHVGYAPAVVAGIAGSLAVGLLPPRWVGEPAGDGLWGSDAGAPNGAEGALASTSTSASAEDHSAVNRSGNGSVLGWMGVALVAGGLIWVPPIVDQLRHDPGNITILIETFRAQTDETIGVGAGTRILLTQLNPVGNWLFGTRQISGSVLPGLALLTAWIASGVAAVRRRMGAVLRLDAILALLVACAWYWAIRLDSARFLYLVEWFWVLTGLVVAATVAVVVTEVAHRQRRGPVGPWVVSGLALVLVMSTASFAWTATGVSPPDMRYSRTVQAIAPAVAADLDPGATYLVTWVDPDALGGNGFGLFLELERRGLTVKAGPARAAPVEPHRVIEPADADAVITVVSGDAQIARARALPGVRELAYDDHRSDAERAEYRSLQQAVMEELRAEGLGEVADGIPTSIWIGLNDPRVQGVPFEQLSRMLTIGQATAVFLSDRELGGL